LTTITGSTAAGGNPLGYVRGDGTAAVVYRGTDNHVHELALQGSSWSHYDLTTLAGAPSTSDNARGYVRSDMVTAVVYRGANGHVYELALH
jgi:hypothetical protein